MDARSHLHNPTGIEAYSPRGMAERVEAAGVVKAGLPLAKLVMLGLYRAGEYFPSVLSTPLPRIFNQR